MTRVIVLGGTGMLGHKLWQESAERFDCWATIRPPALEGIAAAVLDPARTVGGVRVEDPDSVARALDSTGATVAVNCIGVVKQAAAADDRTAVVRTNALFPHEVAGLCGPRGVRLIQISTDCVFSGDHGGYREDDVPDARDLYGRSKLVGEVSGDGCLTIRTSIVGRELEGSHGLLEWLVAHRGGRVRGFTQAVFSGLTTRALARELAAVIDDHPALDGVWHLGGQPITKHDLLLMAREALGLDVPIEPDDSVALDRSLDSARFRAATGRPAPSWRQMLAELASDPTPYDSIRRRGLAHR